MMSAAPLRLTEGERVRLINVLERLASDQLGERAAAALLASRILDRTGLRWPDVFPSNTNGNGVRHRQSSQQSSRDWRAEAAWCLRHTDRLTDWEESFCRSLTVRREAPSERQLACLTEILGMVGAP